jgi:hypothetical protein
VTNDRQVRMKGDTLKLVRIFAGEMQMKTGENFSDDAAIYEMFKQYRPDIIERLKEIEVNQSDKSD